MSLFEELKRRNVIRVAIAYLVTAWLLLQVSDVILDNFDTPDWVFKVFMLALAIGLPLAVIFAWAFELTPEGLSMAFATTPASSISNPERCGHWKSNESRGCKRSASTTRYQVLGSPCRRPARA